MASELFLLAGDDVVLDLVVRRLRDDALADQLVLPLVGAILDDLLGVGVADPGQRLEVGLRGAVEIELPFRLLSAFLASSAFFESLLAGASFFVGVWASGGEVPSATRANARVTTSATSPAIAVLRGWGFDST